MTTSNTEVDNVGALLQQLTDTNDAIQNSISLARTLLSLPVGVSNDPLNYLETFQEISIIPLVRQFNRLVSQINGLPERDYFRESIDTVYNSFRYLAQLVGRIIRQSRESSHVDFPADREDVERLTQIIIAANHVNAESECSICTEPFQLGEDARQMPCHQSHIFHTHCLLPWLERQTKASYRQSSIRHIDGTKRSSEHSRKLTNSRQSLQQNFDGTNFIIQSVRDDHVEISEVELAADREDMERLTQIIIAANHVNAESECSICTEPFQVGDDARQMPCHESHIFHARCLVQWLERRNNCPTCRTRLVRPINGISDSQSEEFITSRTYNNA
ncbi:E3 ubiquitin-protein ligase AIP2-like [Cryptomeria japonica]|uniref:E3 ubiquitin-protein ligase AIP2-like n=1 Tax=Cryptomeria japonica TaxID=3369 RepID=UPI0027DA4FF0|nr:E3 ubiquitin-protein ligase AIP2-like [Cryptomeria japonica]